MARDTRILISGKTITYVMVGLLCLVLPLFLLTDFYYVPFALVFGVAFMALIFYSPYIGLLIYTFLFLIRAQEWVGILSAVPIPMERPLAILLLVSVVLRNILWRDNRFRITRIDSTLLIYVSVVLMSVFTAIRPDVSFGDWQDLAKLALLQFLVAGVIRTREELKLYVTYIIVLTAFYSFWSVKGYYTGMRNYRMGIWRAIGPDFSYGAPNSLGISLASTFPLIYYHVRREAPRLVNLALMGVMALILWNIILTGSRTAMSGMVMFFMLLVWQSRNRARNLILSAVVMVCVWMVMPQQYRERFESTAEISAEEDTGTGAATSASARIEGVMIGMRMVADRPFLGYGIGNWGYASGTFYNPLWWGNAHTLIGQIIGEIGLLGTIAFIVWIAALFQAIARVRRYYLARNDAFMSATALALRTMLILLLVLGLGGHILFRYSWFLISSIVAAQLKLMEQDEVADAANLTEVAEPQSEEPATSAPPAQTNL